ncbi:sulfotransferase [Shimia sp.]|uniref:tetratricopeptide repeat-containing sulfotransferase family protein n=1 Tax=Shimia sp. TaxID=1954381 RepID=UPI0035672B58
MAPRLSADKAISRAKQAAKSGDLATAVTLLGEVLARFPASKKARKAMADLRAEGLVTLLEAGQRAQRAGRSVDAIRELEAAFALAPEIIDTGLALGACQMEIRMAPEALSVADKVLERFPGNPKALNIRGQALRELGRGEEAIDCLTSALGDPETDVHTLNNLGVLARARGETEAAAAYCRQALALQPNDPLLHANLAYVTKYTADHPHLSQMRERLAARGTNDPESAALCFALFKAMDDYEASAEAMEHLHAANRLKKAALEYDFKDDAQIYALSKVLFKTAPAALSETGKLRPVFVTGLPRTGTSLVERVLAQSPEVQACGELAVVQNAVANLLRTAMARQDRALTEQDFVDMRRRLLRGLSAHNDGHPVMVDKMPLNFRWIGYICAALPEARILHVNRDPMAVAWSLYRHNFVGDANGFAYDIDDIARFMVLHRDLMAHWRALYPGRVFDVDYAQLVTDPDTATRALAGAAGLDWTAQMLSPEKGAAQVLTASAEQVRKPIYKDSDLGWKRYQDFLGPMQTALQTAGLIRA